MLRHFLLSLFVIISIAGIAQPGKIAEILKTPETKIDYYDLAEAGSWILYLPMEFGKSAFTYGQEDAITKLKNADVARVDLVYSDYPARQDFGPLNKKRFESLQKLLPLIFTNSNIEFRKVRQTIAKTKRTAEGLQHGFFIYFRPKPTKEETAGEIKKLKEIVRSTTAGSTDKSGKPDSSGIIWGCTISIVVDTTGLSGPGWDKVREMSNDGPTTVEKWSVKDYIKKGQEPPINAKDYEGTDSIYRVVIGTCIDYSSEVFMYQTIDSTVSTVFKRNSWKGAMVIADVTGSMYPYTGQLLK